MHAQIHVVLLKLLLSEIETQIRKTAKKNSESIKGKQNTYKRNSTSFLILILITRKNKGTISTITTASTLQTLLSCKALLGSGISASQLRKSSI